MKTCRHCNRENDDAVSWCLDCGTSLDEAQMSSLPSVNATLGEMQNNIWDQLAIKRGRIYIAGIVVGILGALLGMLKYQGPGSAIWMLPAGGAMGFGAVAFVKFANALQDRITKARSEGKSVALLQILFVFLGLTGLVGIAALVAGLIALLI